MDQLIAGPGIYVCNGCVDRCEQVLAETPARPASAAGSGSDVGSGSGAAVVTWTGLDDDDMLTKLPRMATVADQVEESMAAWVGELRRRGVIWQRVRAALGRTRQSAWMRFAGRS